MSGYEESNLFKTFSLNFYFILFPVYFSITQSFILEVLTFWKLSIVDANFWILKEQILDLEIDSRLRTIVMFKFMIVKVSWQTETEAETTARK